MERALVEKTRRAGIRVFGPNCTGVIVPQTRIDTTIQSGVEMRDGSISVFSQSGAMAGAILMLMADQPAPLGFSKWAHVGNMCDVNTLDVLRYYGEDDATKVICLYLEGFDDGRALLDEAEKVTAKKPVLALKVGRNELGAKAAFSHTGSLAGRDEVYDAAFRKCGIMRMDNLHEMIDTAKTISMQPLPKGSRVCILTEAGGPGSMAMDELGKHKHLQLAHISEEGREKLRQVLPSMAMICEPDGYIDMSAVAMEKHHADALEIVLAEEGVDAVILITVPPNFLSPISLVDELLARKISTDKPILTCLLAGKNVRQARSVLESQGWPTYDLPEHAVRCMARMGERRNYLDRLK